MRLNRRGRIRSTLAAVLAAAVLLLTGCWDLEEIENRGLVLSLGFDKTPDGQVEATVQLPRPQALNYSRGQPTGPAAEQFLTISAVGPTPWDAFLEADKQTSRKLYLGHLQNVVVGEALARDGIQNITDGLMRRATVNRQARILLARNAKAIVSQPISGELLPALYFSTFYEANSNDEATADIRIWRVWHAILTPYRTAILPVVRPSGPQFLLEGFGLFSNGSLAAIAEGRTARGVNWVLGQITSGVLEVEADGRKFTLRIKNVRRTVRDARWEDGEAHLTLSLKVSVTLSEDEQGSEQLDTAVIRKLEKSASSIVQEEALEGLKIAQNAGADVFGLGEKMRASDPRHWNTETWLKKFKTAEVRVQVETDLHSTGVID